MIGVEVQVEVAALGQAAIEHAAVERGEEPALAFMGQPIAVGGERGRFGQRGQPGEQPSGGVGGEIVDMGDAAYTDELERQQRQHRADRGDDPGAGIAGGGDHPGHVEGDQVGHRQQQAGQLGVASLGQRLEVDHLGAGQGLAAGRATRHIGSAPQAFEAFGGDHLGDAGAVQRGAFRAQRHRDLVDLVPGAA